MLMHRRNMEVSTGNGCFAGKWKSLGEFSTWFLQDNDIPAVLEGVN